MDNIVRFGNKNKVRILQVSDPQDLKYVRKSMVRMLDNAYDILKPDLVVFTGDNILGNHLLDARFGSRKIGSGHDDTLDSMTKSLRHILDPLEKRSIPFAMIYGNHDDMNCITKEEHATIYRGYSNCMDMNTDNPEIDCDTYYIDCIGKDNNVVFRIYMLDSAWQDKDEKKECHCEIKESTVKWIREVNVECIEKGIPALIFTHIPLPVTMELTEECSAEDVGAVKSENGYIRLNTVKATGYMGERPCVLESDNGLYDYINAAGNVKAVVTGHDHTNLFEGRVGNISFIQSGCASFRCYGNSWTRGVRLFEIDVDGSFSSKYYTYFDLAERTVPERIRYFWDSDENESVKFRILEGFALSGASVLTAKLLRKLR